MKSDPPSRRPSGWPLNRNQAGLYRNWVSYGGAIVATAGLLVVVIMEVATLSLKQPSPYIGIFTYLVFPGVILAGLFVVLVGIRLESTRRRKAGSNEPRPYPTIDFNNPRHRRRAGIFAGIGFVLFIVLTYAGYNGFLLTESVEFCGKTCHTQMGPEFHAYESSPHARVPCVDCHVGDGAGYYVHSKVNGVSQLFAVMTGHYDRPISTPIKGLRPARETCQECHWEQKWWGSQLYQRAHFRYDEASTPDQLTMLIKTGGGGVTGAGIHWHMLIENEVTFSASDDRLQEIPWVKVKRRDGSVTEYFRTDKTADRDALAKLPKRTMDCMDCHNRPAHVFETPDVAVDKALANGSMSQTLPWVKSLSVDSLSKDYASREAAHAGLRKDIFDFYKEKYPSVSAARAADIEKMVGTVQALYDRNVFPEMKVSWKSYPSNIGHRNSAGCFRCHDGKHVAADGKVLISECKACHTDPQRGPQSGMGEAMTAREKDWHPWQTPEKHLAVAKHSEILCHECHVAGRRPKTECNECHSH